MPSLPSRLRSRLPGGRAPRQRLYLHVGLPKSGSSYLQTVLADNRERLREAGFVYPFAGPEAMFHAAVELRGQEELWGLDPELVAGSWQRLLARARTVGATGVVSHEILAGAAPEVVDRIRHDTADLELHVVVTVRDLARQVTAHWQEEVKNGRPWSFAEMEAALGTPAESAAAELGFWRSQDLADVVRRWGAAVPPERLHVVVVPQPGAPRPLLWQRFATTLGLDPEVVDLSVVRRGNDSLGVVQVAWLRRVVAALEGRLDRRDHALVVKRFFAERVLAAGTSRRAEAPPELVARLRPVASRWPAVLRGAGHPVTGDLADLLPAAVGGPPVPRDPDDVTEAELLEDLPRVLGEVAAEMGRRAGSVPRVGLPPGPTPGVLDAAAALLAGLLVDLAEARRAAADGGG